MIRRRLLYLCVFYHIVTCESVQLCGNQFNIYSPTSCIEERSIVKDALNAHNDCKNGGRFTGLATFEEFVEYEHLKRYVALSPVQNEFHWLGYYYMGNTDTVLLRVNNASSSQGSIFNSVNRTSPGLCIAIGKDGQLYRRMCLDQLPYLCYTNLAPRITSFTANASRYVSSGDSLTLTCSVESATKVEWRFNGTNITERATSLDGQSNLVLSDIDVPRDLGMYQCVACNTLGCVVSKVIVLVNDTAEVLNSTDVAPVITSIDISMLQGDLRTGSNFNLTCNTATNGQSSSYYYDWYINGYLTNTTTNTFIIKNFQTPGFYQCGVFSQSTGEYSVYTTRLDPQDPPGEVFSPIALSNNKTSVLVKWLIPDDNNINPKFLRYKVFFTSDENLDYSTASVVDNVLPVNMSGSVSKDGIVEYTLGNLNQATTYVVTVRADSAFAQGEEGMSFALTSTFGNAPPENEPITGLKVSKTKDGTALYMIWDKFKSNDPMTGEIAQYELEYRNAGKDFSNSIRILASYNEFTILSIEDAREYEVRVRAGVQVERGELPKYEYGPWTKWTKPESVFVGTLPEPPPTLPVRPFPPGAVAGIIIGVCVGSLIAVILIVGLVCLCIRNRHKDHIPRGRADSMKVAFSHIKDKEDSPEVVLDTSPSKVEKTHTKLIGQTSSV